MSVDGEDTEATLGVDAAAMELEYAASEPPAPTESETPAPTESEPPAPTESETDLETTLERPKRDSVGKFSDPLPIPERYKVKRRLGRGGMGDVLEAYDDHLGRAVAIKLLAPKHWPNRSVRERLLREGRAAASLDHPAIVKVHDLDPKGRYIVMELVRGDSLDTRLDRRKRFSAAEVRSIGLALCDALAAAHAAGIVHRDVKPANILFDEKGRMRLADFGVASVIDSDLTATGAQLGTPAYMAPEQLRASGVDGRADIYSTGATLFEAATGLRLHGSTSIRDPRKSVLEFCGDRKLARAIARAVEEEPEDRFQTIEELSEALTRKRGNRSIVIGLVAAAAIAAIATVGVVELSGDDEPAAGAPAAESQTRVAPGQTTGEAAAKTTGEAAAPGQTTGEAAAETPEPAQPVPQIEPLDPSEVDGADPSPGPEAGRDKSARKSAASARRKAAPAARTEPPPDAASKAKAKPSGMSFDDW